MKAAQNGLVSGKPYAPGLVKMAKVYVAKSTCRGWLFEVRKHHHHSRIEYRNLRNIR